MGNKTGIQWTDKTWNPWTGCIKVSQGCKNCYMYRDQQRYGNDPREIRRTSPMTFDAPLKWGDPAMVFTCSWSDFFIEESDIWRGEAWDIIRRTPHLTYQILTKRPERISRHLPDDWGNGYSNVWLGVSVEDRVAYGRIPHLRSIPAAVRFLSCEPLLESIPSMNLSGIHWVIVGGESGPDARPMLAEWAEDIRQQCDNAGIAYFFKQMGGKSRINGHWGGNTLNGQEYQEFPLRGALRQMAAGQLSLF